MQRPPSSPFVGKKACKVLVVRAPAALAPLEHAQITYQAVGSERIFIEFKQAQTTQALRTLVPGALEILQVSNKERAAARAYVLEGEHVEGGAWRSVRTPAEAAAVEAQRNADKRARRAAARAVRTEASARDARERAQRKAERYAAFKARAQRNREARERVRQEPQKLPWELMRMTFLQDDDTERALATLRAAGHEPALVVWTDEILRAKNSMAGWPSPTLPDGTRARAVVLHVATSAAYQHVLYELKKIRKGTVGVRYPWFEVTHMLVMSPHDLRLGFCFDV